MDTDGEQESRGKQPERLTMSMAEFLESQPPGVFVNVTDLHVFLVPSGWRNNFPDLQLHCDSDLCNGVRVFTAISGESLIEEQWKDFFARYWCRNCKSGRKTYSLFARNTEGHAGIIYKHGEYPTFGPPVPPRLISLIGPDRDLFLKGRRCENMGLGVGAFAYYRRAVENQWSRLIREITNVAERINAPAPMIETLKKCSDETQFTKAVDLAKDAIPEMLLIRGHNPLTLLHKALSEGLHNEPDDYCLGLAQSIRVILTELAERMATALKDEAELRDAVSRLLNRKKEK